MTPEKPKILIILEDGEIQCVYSDIDCKYAIVNYSLRDTDINPVLGVFDSETVQCDLKELFNPTLDDPEDVNPEYIKIYKTLVDQEF